MRSQKSQPSRHVFDNLDEILSQRSLCNDSDVPSVRSSRSGISILRKRSMPERRGGSSIPSSLEESSEDGRVGLTNGRIVRRHSAATSLDKQQVRPVRGPLPASSGVDESIIESESETSSVSDIVENDRVLDRRRIVQVPSPARVDTHTVSDTVSDDLAVGDESPVQNRRGLLSCLGCFTATPNRRAPRSNVQSPSSLDGDPVLANSLRTSELLYQNPYCQRVHELLMRLSEHSEIFTENSNDKRIVFLFFAAVSGEPLLSPEEWDECDEWVDWLSLGYSDDTIDAFERDINRHGSQSMGLLFQLFFALHYTGPSRLASLIIRNVHFEPSALFGLFAINCCKWARDVISTSLVGYRGGKNMEEPPLFASAQKVIGKFSSFSKCLSWWIHAGHGKEGGRIESVEAKFGDGAVGGAVAVYESLDEESENDDDVMTPDSGGTATRRGSKKHERPESKPSSPPPLHYHSSAASSVRSARRSSTASVHNETCRLPDVVKCKEDFAFLRQVFVVGGLYYSYCVLSFAKFWLEKDLISVDADSAREKLSNAYLDKEFVSRLKFNSAMTCSELVARNKVLCSKLRKLWKASGWKAEDLRGQPNEESDDDDE